MNFRKKKKSFKICQSLSFNIQNKLEQNFKIVFWAESSLGKHKSIPILYINLTRINGKSTIKASVVQIKLYFALFTQKMSKLIFIR